MGGNSLNQKVAGAKDYFQEQHGPNLVWVSPDRTWASIELPDFLAARESHALWVELGAHPGWELRWGTDREGRYVALHLDGELLYLRYLYYVSVEQAIAEAWLVWKRQMNS